ncbi:MAG TPA: GNAT family N-acetyltransferase [Burkholderiales bacterium]|nr:GNAT family N-acetyltransferase [Burkholderiales bacterium]
MKRSPRFMVRDAQPADRTRLVTFVAALQDLERTLHAGRAEGRRIAAAHLVHLQRAARERGGRVLVAARGDERLGFLVGWVEEEEPGSHHVRPGERRYGVVTELYVAPGARARGIAVALLEEAARHFGALGLARLRVRTLAANQAALRFYRALGYAPYELTLERELPHAARRRAARRSARRAPRARGRG